MIEAVPCSARRSSRHEIRVAREAPASVLVLAQNRQRIAGTTLRRTALRRHGDLDAVPEIAKRSKTCSSSMVACPSKRMPCICSDAARNFSLPNGA